MLPLCAAGFQHVAVTLRLLTAVDVIQARLLRQSLLLSHHQVLLVLLVCCDFRLVLCQQVTIYIGKILWSAHDLLLCYCADNLLC